MDFAIVAMDCVLPGALGTDALLRATREGTPAFSEVPLGRWPDGLAVGSAPGEPDAVATRVGGFVADPPFDGDGLRLDGFPIHEVDPIFRWVLRVVRGVAPAVASRPKTDLFLANLSLPTTGAIRVTSAPYRDALARLGVAVPWLEGGTDWDRWQSALPAKLASRALGLGGASVALDAACASGLYAVRLACDRLESGACDDAIAAGVNAADSAFLFLGFSQLRALSKTGRSRPFDRRADGLLVGEGAAAVRIRRLDDAVRDGDRIQAVIRGGSLGNDGRKGNLLAPDRHGQLRTLRAAWARAGLDPRSAGLFECHATGTPLGDRTEVEALQALFDEVGGARDKIVLSSSKALMGHLVTCAGLAGLMRAVFAVRDGFFPAIPCEDVIPLGDGFRVVSRPTPWDAEARVAGVSAFGFGGTNAHLVIERWRPGAAWRRDPPRARPRAIAVVGVGARLGGLDGAAVVGHALLSERPLVAPAPVAATRGLGQAPDGVYCEEITVDGARWRIPPAEIERLLPQQLMVLTAAAEAMAGLSLDPERTASVIGMGVDHHIGEDVVRAAIRSVGRDDLADDVIAAADASRIQGLLPNFVANRLAALLDLRGPSYTVSTGETSAFEAMEQAVSMLCAGEVDAAVVGAVDAPGHVGAAAVAAKHGENPAEGAVVFVLRRLDDAVQANEPVLAVLGGADGPSVEINVATQAERIGHADAAASAFALFEAVIRVRDGVRPGRRPWTASAARSAVASATPRLGAAMSVRVSGSPRGSREPYAVAPPVVVSLRAADAPALAARVQAVLARLASGGALADLEPDRGGSWGFAFVAGDEASAVERLRRALPAIASGDATFTDPRGGFVRRRIEGRVAFVYPASGTGYSGMGAGLWLAWPSMERALAGRSSRVRPWGELPGDSPVDSILSGAWLGIAVTDLLRDRLGLQPDDAIGVSLGESTALVSLGAWRDADGLEARMVASPMFRTELAGPMTAVQDAYRSAGLAFDPADPYRSVVLMASRAVVEDAIRDIPGVSLQMVDAPGEVVIGGERGAVARVLAKLPGVTSFPAPFAACVHSPEVANVADAYRALHLTDVTDPGVRIWSAADAAPYRPTADACADAIVRQACGLVDVPRLVEAAWDAGVRVFVEVGPRGSCTRWVDQILGAKPHLAVACTRAGADEPWQLAMAVAELCAAGIEVDPRRLFVATPPASRWLRPVRVPHSGPSVRWGARVEEPMWTGSFGGDRVPAPRPGTNGDVIRYEGPASPAMLPLQVGGWLRVDPAGTNDVRSTSSPSVRGSNGVRSAPTAPVTRAVTPPVVPAAPRVSPAAPPVAPPQLAVPITPVAAPFVSAMGVAELAGALSRSQVAMAAAHDQFLASELQAQAQFDAWNQLLLATISQATSAPAITSAPRPAPPVAPPAPLVAVASTAAPVTATPRQFDLAALERFAAGRISECLGPAYADLDDVSPRVRLPMDPLLLVSRVIDVEGERGKLGAARIITEYDIPRDAWWSHDGEAPPCVCVESGQADLFLVSYLGIDAITRGRRVYRLLDCDLTFHGPRPRLGETLRHDIRIHRFAKLGETILFYFEYDCISTTDGRPVLSMRNGCAGFFTPKELEKPQGARVPADRPLGAAPPPRILGAPTSLDAAAVDALTEGRFSAALGSAFAACDGSTLTLSRAPWRLVHRVPVLLTSGGPHGFGRVVVQQDLRDDDWFNPCHFLGDPCMPGTLMFDGCCQALSLWLIAGGYPSDYPNATFEPIPDVAAKLRCRGQVVPGHTLLEYDVRVKSAGLTPTPFAIADVVLSVNGTPVVLAEDVSIRIHGDKVAPVPRPTVDAARVLEYSVGDPSRAFGPRFLPYDAEKRTARMPGPPYLTMTRVACVDGAQGELANDRSVDIEYDVPDKSWYFEASPGTPMPFAHLTEVTLQPCGWLTAWQAAAIAAQGDVYFRNLGGTLTLHRAVWPGDGTLTTTARQTTISKSGGMIIHGFDVTMRRGDEPILECKTQFGYFTAGALANQKGLTPDREDERAGWREAGRVCEDMRDAPIVHGVRPRADLRMIDRITAVLATGGKRGLGFYAAEKDVDPTSWYYWAHFHQDPVMPGSLGLEAACQLTREVLMRAFGAPAAGQVAEPMAVGTSVTWKYRGQVPPTRRLLAVELEVVAVDVERQQMTFDALIRGDGMPIYEIAGLVVRWADAPKPTVVATPPRQPAAALIDTLTIDGDRAEGRLRLSAAHPWYRDHCPTVVVPALPMAFAAEIAAEVASAMGPGRLVVGIDGLEARKWIAGDGVDVRIDAVRAGDEVAVTLSMWSENARFPRLSGWQVHMRATARLGDAYPTPIAAPPPAEGDEFGMSAPAYYDGGHTFHGPTLQGLVRFGLRSDRAIDAVFRTKHDAELLGEGCPAFILDPLLLDTATHPMLSGNPETWVPGLTPGKLAYPVKADAMTFYAPRPVGEVRATLRLVSADAAHLAFDVWLSGDDGLWATFRWTEALVEGGPLLGLPAEVRRPFCWERTPNPSVAIGRAVGDRWRVAASDLVEPLAGTLVRLYGAPEEVTAWAAAADPDAHAIAWFAAKEAACRWVSSRIGRAVHPTGLTLCRMRDDRFVLVEAPALTAQEFTDNLGPTRFDLEVRVDGAAAEARVVPRHAADHAVSRRRPDSP